MDAMIISALISGGFALVGTIVGIIGSSKITVYRIEQLEKKVDSMGNLLDRTTRMEEQISSMKQDISEVKSHLRNLDK